MIYTLSGPQHIDTTIQLPPSKSISNRALIIQALANGNLVPRHLSDCDDTKVIVEALKTKSETIDIKAAGTAMRFLTAYLSVREGEHVLTGTDRMKQRPIGVILAPIFSMKARWVTLLCVLKDIHWQEDSLRFRVTLARSLSQHYY